MRADPRRINSNIRANQEPAKEPCQCTADERFLAGVHGPILGADVVCYAKYHRMGIDGDVIFGKHRDGCAIVDNDGNVFEAVDRDKSLVLIIFHVQQSSLNDRIREW